MNNYPIANQGSQEKDMTKKSYFIDSHYIVMSKSIVLVNITSKDLMYMFILKLSLND